MRTFLKHTRIKTIVDESKSMQVWRLVQIPAASFPELYKITPSLSLTGRLNLLREAEDDAVIWPKSTLTVALAK